MKRAHAAVTRYGGLVENKYGDEDERNCHLGVKCGDNQEEKSSSKLSVDFNNEHVVTKFEEFTAPLEGLSKDDCCVVLRLRSDDPETAAAELEEKVDEVKMMA